MTDPDDALLARFEALLAEAGARDDAAEIWPGLTAAWAKATRAVGRAGSSGPDREAADAQGAADDEATWHGMIGASPAMLALRDSIERFATVDSPVLIRGESGTGKDLVARIIHSLGPRSDRPMVCENCAAIPENLLESVLFGHVRGSFTGAVRDHPGHFVAAHRGTLFLDEIGDMPLAMQAKILRVLQEGEVRAVGGEKVRKVDVRVIAATNRDLGQMVRDRTFREDLYFRLDVLSLELPPLRDRGDDVLRIARALLRQSAERAGGRALCLSDAAAAAIGRFEWPGNIRQLQNEIQRLAALADGPEVGLGDLSPEVRASTG